MSINQWTAAEVYRAENSWGQQLPQYSLDMYDFAIKGCKSWLDLGCGFGRYLNYLINLVEDPDYIGYDSSLNMISRIGERFPVYSSRVFHRDITAPINNHQQSVVCSAVLIHITLEDQIKVLNNIKSISPKKITFDINSPDEAFLLKKDHFERFIKGAEGNFRMTWQSHYLFTRFILNLFKGYQLSTKFYVVNKNRNKVLYMLEKLGTQE